MTLGHTGTTESAKSFTSLQSLDAVLGVDLWLLSIGAEPRVDSGGALSEAERNRAARFGFDRDRMTYVAGQLALRQLLSARTGIPPARLEFERGIFGKPHLRGDAWTFNVSRSHRFALIAIAEKGAIGVDIECVRPVSHALRLATELYTPDECADIATSIDRDVAFLSCWTRKEAILKAVGCGLSIETGTFKTGTSGATRLVEILFEGNCFTVAVASLDVLPGCVGAVASVLQIVDRHERGKTKKARPVDNRRTGLE